VLWSWFDATLMNHTKMQALFKFRAVPRSFVRSFSMGKPEDYEPTAIGHTRAGEKEKKSVNEPTTKKFTKAFQHYLDTRLTYEEMMNQADAEKKKPSQSSTVGK